MSIITRKCIHCGIEFKAKSADVKRGWAKNCSKSCAASSTNKKTGNFQRYCSRNERFDDDINDGFSVYGESWDDHKFDGKI